MSVYIMPKFIDALILRQQINGEQREKISEA